MTLGPDLGVFRFRILLRATRDIRVHPYPAAVLYGLLAAARKRVHPEGRSLPDGLIVDVAEQARTAIDQGSDYAFGLTWLGASSSWLGKALDELTEGLRQVGAHVSSGRPALGGNFEVSEVRDLVADESCSGGYRPTPIPEAHYQDEIARLDELSELTLRFSAPLRCRRPSGARRPGHSFFDDGYFRPEVWMGRLGTRLGALGVPPMEPGDPSLALLENRLVWLDLSYGHPGSKKSLGGAVGRVRLGVRDRAAIGSIVLGQYLRLGEGSRFGFGAYRVEQLPPDPYRAQRSRSLVELSMQPHRVADVSGRQRLPAGVLSSSVRSVVRREYRPGPTRRIELDRGGSVRTLHIPAPVDLALQRLVLDQLAPALDRLFEESSFAFRKGLSRHSAARRIRAAYRDGFRHAWRCDFRRFFDSIDHGLLKDKLDAYVGDPALVELIMLWVRGVGSARRGLPTGAPVSPLLANLFLDRFDEEIERSGCRLVRYADDFLVLFREPEAAQEAWREASESARRLLLELNSEKTEAVEIGEPFEFLGFRFVRRDRWRSEASQLPMPVDDLGWFSARPNRRSKQAHYRLPGEGARLAPTPKSVAIVGPEPTTVELDGDQIVCFRVSPPRQSRFPLRRLREMICLGPVAVTQTARTRLLEAEVPVVFCTAGGRPIGTLWPVVSGSEAEVLEVQVAAMRDEARAVDYGRRWVSAKLRNYAALAQSTGRRRSDPDLADALLTLADRAEGADSVDTLLGYEGAGAARWYRDLGTRLGRGFTFARRVAPSADDPVNVLLNIAHTHLHRQCSRELRRAGLAPTVGILHRPRRGHDALASDLQEPLRHLMAREVIRATHEMRPSDFLRREGRSSSGRLIVRPPALRQFYSRLQQVWALPCHAKDRAEPARYEAHLSSQVRSLRRALHASQAALYVFEHP